MLRGEDFIAAHPGKPVVARVELADVVEAVPVVVTGSIEAGLARPRRAELARLGAAGGIAAAALVRIAAMESIVLHPFHMATDRLEGKSWQDFSHSKWSNC